MAESCCKLRIISPAPTRSSIAKATSATTIALRNRCPARLPDARLEVYEGTGHAVHWDQPLRFARDVAAFSRYSAALQLSR